MSTVVKTKGLFGSVTYDSLNNQKLADGDVVGIVWPDGSSGEYTVHLDVRMKDSAAQITDTLSYIVDEFRGTTNRVYLRWKKDSDVKLIRFSGDREVFGSMKQ